ncbi:hypothetical protein A4A49_15267 [Nicotiana attenuata]|uniref:Uncharacterized protein n=1 Tax=Nicotiana attenuata TaxID=49451 RepID=A0A1J6IQQ5_NICAT|nr:hypothetical protein A4A49_15267 [Nicotiana attenuata]
MQTTIVNLKSATNGVMRKSGKGFKNIDSNAQSNNLQTTTTINLKLEIIMRKNSKGFKKTNIDVDAQNKNLQTITVNMKSAREVDCSGDMRMSGKGFKKMDIDADTQSKNIVTTLTATKRCTEEILVNKKRSRVDFESSKRKYEDRVAEQNKAKRRTIMVDFHEMPKLVKDPCAPKHCSERRRF